MKKSEAEKTNIRRKLEETVQKMSTLDEAKNALQKEVGDLRSSLREVEKARLEARRELQQVHNQVGVSKLLRNASWWAFLRMLGKKRDLTRN